MVITDKLIEKAEALLLPAGKSFDDERRAFIKSLDHRDLMAVPGSGKTTALQAKLFCMAKQLPLDDGSGILVLSHTNTAVDELKRLLQGSCPHLFEYPNFVGTIQQFVDKYLAIPFYESCFGKSIESIEADRYYKECDKYVNARRGLAANHVQYKFASDNKHYHYVRFSLNDAGGVDLTMGINGREVTVNAPQTWIRANTVEENTKAVLDFLVDMKKCLLKEGYLHYDDCYFLANCYLRKKPSIINVIRDRFRFVFVDEAQDTQKHQLDLLNQLFEGDSCECYQLIGDPNQSIFSSLSRATTLQWRGKNPRYINKSIRLTPMVSNVVNNLVTDKGHEEGREDDHFQVTGLRQLDVEIQPQMILYDGITMGQLKDKFEELIQQFNLEEVDRVDKHGFHIIGWAATKTEDSNKLHLEDIFPDYHYKPSESFVVDSLSKAMQDESVKDDFKKSHKLVIDILLKVLYLNGIKTAAGNNFNKTKLTLTVSLFQDSIKKQYSEGLFNCAKELAAGNKSRAYIQLKSFIENSIQTIFHAECNDTAKTFIGEQYEEIIVAQPEENAEPEGNIKIGTIHSTKGRTHCATMYVETYYEGKYEIEHLMENKRGEILNPLYGDDVSNTGVYAASARKMMYVGFSRPTHLLCYATEKRRWTDEALIKMRGQGWNIIDLTNVM